MSGAERRAGQRDERGREKSGAERRAGQREERGREKSGAERRVEKREKVIVLPLLENLDSLPGPTHAFIACR